MLAAACDGRLTEEWRGQQVNLPNSHDLLENIKQEWDEFAKATGKKIKPLEPSHDERIADLSTLPQEWTWIRVNEISSNIVDCLHSTAKFVSSGYYCIDTTCIENSRICFDKARFVSEETYLDRIRRLKPTEGDILFSREGTVGTTVIVPKNVDLCLGQRMMMFRPLQSVMPKFFMYFFQSTTFSNQYKPLIGGTTSPHLNIKDIIQLHFPLCSLPEQQEIVRRVDALFAFADSVEAKVAAAREKTERLRQSILAKAFSGELVPTEAEIARQEGRGYESAGELLERIRKEGKVSAK
ncbi:MAG TPA: type I restriction endonuclease subunit S [Clostridiales bacterium]|nr:type I restriction endonuclease subunit S [Clostridiales bacterium]